MQCHRSDSTMPSNLQTKFEVCKEELMKPITPNMLLIGRSDNFLARDLNLKEILIFHSNLFMSITCLIHGGVFG